MLWHLWLLLATHYRILRANCGGDHRSQSSVKTGDDDWNLKWWIWVFWYHIKMYGVQHFPFQHTAGDLCNETPASTVPADFAQNQFNALFINSCNLQQFLWSHQNFKKKNIQCSEFYLHKNSDPTEKPRHHRDDHHFYVFIQSSKVHLWSVQMLLDNSITLIGMDSIELMENFVGDHHIAQTTDTHKYCRLRQLLSRTITVDRWSLRPVR